MLTAETLRTQIALQIGKMVFRGRVNGNEERTARVAQRGPPAFI
jgi:hypothetical protein